MHIASFIISIIAIGTCWITLWNIPISGISLIVSMIMFYIYFLGDKKNEKKKYRGLVFSSFVLSAVSIMGAFIMTGIPVGLTLVLSLT